MVKCFALNSMVLEKYKWVLNPTLVFCLTPSWVGGIPVAISHLFSASGVRCSQWSLTAFFSLKFLKLI